MDREEKSLRAAEYLLGLLSAREARQLEEDLPGDAELRAEVEEWHARLAVLFDGAETEPPGRVARELRGALFADEEQPPLAETVSGGGWLTAALVVKAIVIAAVVVWLLLGL